MFNYKAFFNICFLKGTIIAMRYSFLRSILLNSMFYENLFMFFTHLNILNNNLPTLSRLAPPQQYRLPSEQIVSMKNSSTHFSTYGQIKIQYIKMYNLIFKSKRQSIRRCPNTRILFIKHLTQHSTRRLKCQSHVNRPPTSQPVQSHWQTQSTNLPDDTVEGLPYPREEHAGELYIQALREGAHEQWGETFTGAAGKWFLMLDVFNHGCRISRSRDYSRLVCIFFGGLSGLMVCDSLRLEFAAGYSDGSSY